MLSAIKQAAVEALEAGQPVAILFGTVTKTNPLEVNVDQRFTLDADFFIVAESLTPLEVDLSPFLSHSGAESGQASSQSVLIRRGLQPGDRVILLRMQGGQKYLIFDRVVSG
jgi:hypothetical protein